ncbi:hypothetical protein VNO77_22896 [Canavalia gladiata]|uniref:Uncharacterized protein n=1 Tax=Canavalia gladiata TaxID=3824 RepID=A0AAN9QB05_CANGL
MRGMINLVIRIFLSSLIHFTIANATFRLRCLPASYLNPVLIVYRHCFAYAKFSNSHEFLSDFRLVFNAERLREEEKEPKGEGKYLVHEENESGGKILNFRCSPFIGSFGVQTLRSSSIAGRKICSVPDLSL